MSKRPASPGPLRHDHHQPQRSASSSSPPMSMMMHGGGMIAAQNDDDARRHVAEADDDDPQHANQDQDAQASFHLPVGVILQVLSFLDGKGLTNCAQTCAELYEVCDYPRLWEAAALHAYPHATTLGDFHTYNGEWKTLLLDGNRKNRSTLYDWNVDNCIRDTSRRYSPIFTMEHYSFQLVVDPDGNPYVPLAKPGVSVYMSCVPTEHVRGIDADGRIEIAENTPPWECCVSFALSVVNKQGLKRDLTWASNLAQDRFNQDCCEWGVHRLISLRRLHDPSNGYLGQPNDQLAIQVRLRLPHFRLKVFTTEALRRHHGFGIADLTTPNYTSSPPLMMSTAGGGGGGGTAAPGLETDSLIRIYEEFQCKTIQSFRDQVATDLGLACPHQLRLWAQTQPWSDVAATPRDLLKVIGNGDEAPQPAAGGGPAVAQPVTLAHVLQAHQDGVGEARIFAEVSGDGGLAFLPSSVKEGDDGGQYHNQEMEQEGEMVASRGGGGGGGRTIGTTGGPSCCLIPTIAGRPLSTSLRMLPEPTDPTAQELAQAAGLANPNQPQVNGNSHPLSDPYQVLLFLKYLQVEGAAPSPHPPTTNNKKQKTSRLDFLSHLVIPSDASARCIFEAVAARVGKRPEDLRALVETPPFCWQPPIHQGDEPQITRFKCLDCPPSLAAMEEGAAAIEKGPPEEKGKKGPILMTCKDMGIQNGEILCFFEKGREEDLKAHYMSLVYGLLREAGAVYAKTGARASLTSPSNCVAPSRPLGSRLQPRLLHEQVVDLFERLGNQRFRIRNTGYEKKHNNARETFLYAIAGRHLGFCCDRCGTTDFSGPRFKCTICDDYDLCPSCQELPVELHRYRFDRRQWKKEDFMAHQHEHTMDMILPIPRSLELLLRYT